MRPLEAIVAPAGLLERRVVGPIATAAQVSLLKAFPSLQALELPNTAGSLLRDGTAAVYPREPYKLEVHATSNFCTPRVMAANKESKCTSLMLIEKVCDWEGGGGNTPAIQLHFMKEA